MLMGFLLFSAHWFISLFCQSFFLHRYCSHKMFAISPLWERFFYLLTYLAQGPSFLNPTSYAIMHNRHHQFSDTEHDPHSPWHSKGLKSMMLKTYDVYKNLVEQTLNNQLEGRIDCPRWKTIDKMGESRLNVYFWILVYPTVYFLLDVPVWGYIFLPFHFFVGPLQGAIVNWFGHKRGYRNFDLPDNSRNTFKIDFFLMGELYQNNHHKFGKRLNFAHKWFEIDFTYLCTLPLIKLGIVKLRNQHA